MEDKTNRREDVLIPKGLLIKVYGRNEEELWSTWVSKRLLQNFEEAYEIGKNSGENGEIPDEEYRKNMFIKRVIYGLKDDCVVGTGASPEIIDFSLFSKMGRPSKILRIITERKTSRLLGLSRETNKTKIYIPLTN